MRPILILIMLLMALCMFGCSRGDIQVSTVLQGQPVPFDGYNIGPDIYILRGEPAKVTGVQIWVNGLDPNDLLE